jgi:beta-glucosidase
VAEAVAAARGADAVVLVMGLNSRLEGEEMRVSVEGFSGGDRTSLNLPRVQQELMERVVAAAAGKPVVLVLMSGSAVAVNWADAHVPAILQSWYGGQAAGTAVADVLFGHVSPAGRLPVTFYKSVDQLPPFESYAMRGRTYRYFTGAPLYPFGHGLSYSRFTYANLTAPRTATAGAPVRVSVEVQNSGTIVADEVVQLYVMPRDPASTAPPRALKGFERLTLQPGERRTVSFTLDDRAWSSIRTDGQRVVGPGRFTIAVGGKQPGLRDTANAATTMVLTADVDLTGSVKPLAP